MLLDARRLGFLGPGDVNRHVDHALAFLDLWPVGVNQAFDLGSGGGLPGLVLALATPTVAWVLVEVNHRRAAFLEAAARHLDLGGHVGVQCQRAEQVGRGPFRSTGDLVVARSFGPPAVTAECAAPLLRVGGALIVAEPPGPANDDGADRWPAEGLAALGLDADAGRTAPLALRRFRQVEPCPERYPRRVGIPAKRPLF